jgi:uncharacterized protein (TIGR00730 family)
MSRLRHLPMSKLAYHDEVFMESLPARPLRILAEYIDPLTRIRRENIADTIVMFGSARIKSREDATSAINKMNRASKGTQKTSNWRGKMASAKRELAMSRYYEEARELSRRITQWSMTLGSDPRRFVICSGGGPGIMEAANRGAHEAGGTSIGLSIQLPHEQRPNPYITPELNICFHYFFMRKLWFAQMAKALIVFPGGFGTMDELWEMLTLLQTGKLSSHHLILIYGRRYWDKVINWKTMVQAGTMNQQEMKLLKFADTVDEAFERLREDLKQHQLLKNDWSGPLWPGGRTSA